MLAFLRAASIPLLRELYKWESARGFPPKCIRSYYQLSCSNPSLSQSPPNNSCSMRGEFMMDNVAQILTEDCYWLDMELNRMSTTGY